MIAWPHWLGGHEGRAQGEVVASLDIGTHKTVCLIARADATGRPQVVGSGHQQTEGMRGGIVSDMEALQRTVTATVSAAEQMAGETLERVIVGISGPRLASQIADVEMPLSGREIIASDIERLLAQAQTLVDDEQAGAVMELLHTLPTQYWLDGQKGVRDPLGMVGTRLKAQVHLVSAAFGPVRTLVTAVAKCRLEVDRLVVAPYASGLTCLVEDEMDLGCLVLDMGAGVTTFALFLDGHMIYADSVSVGGWHITSDIARGLTTSLAEAERLKTLHGSVIAGPSDEREMLDVPQVGEHDAGASVAIPRSQLIQIIQPRVEEIFDLVQAKIESSGHSAFAGRRVVLTGGGSQLAGLRDLAQTRLGKQARLGRPLRIVRPYPASVGIPGSLPPLGPTGLAETSSGPAFSTAAGLLAVALQPDFTPTAFEPGLEDSAGLWDTLTQWIRRNI